MVYKATLRIKNNLIVLRKGKPAQVGEVRTYSGIKMRKQADGKWKPVTDSKPKKPEETVKKPGESSPKTENSVPNTKREKFKIAFKDAIKGIANVFGDLYSGGSGTDTAIQEVKREGENLKQIGEASKQQSALKKQKQIAAIKKKKEQKSPKKSGSEDKPKKPGKKDDKKIDEKTDEIDKMFEELDK